MKSLVRVGALSGALLLGGCGSWSPSLDFMPSLSGITSGPTVSLTIESDPPGADARSSTGASCKTPCMIPVPAEREFTVSYSLNGYQPQSIAVRPRIPDNTRPDVESGGAAQPVELTPNPVYAQLDPVPAPAPARKKSSRPKAAKAKEVQQQ